MNNRQNKKLNWFSKHPVLLISQICWAGVFIYFGYSGYGTSGETALSYSIFIIMLSFPSSLIFSIFSILNPRNFDTITFDFLAFLFVIGYLQWFILTPFTFQLIKKKRSKPQSQTSFTSDTTVQQSSQVNPHSTFNPHPCGVPNTDPTYKPFPANTSWIISIITVVFLSLAQSTVTYSESEPWWNIIVGVAILLLLTGIVCGIIGIINSIKSTSNTILPNLTGITLNIIILSILANNIFKSFK